MFLNDFYHYIIGRVTLNLTKKFESIISQNVDFIAKIKGFFKTPPSLGCLSIGHVTFINKITSKLP